jgi:hypothetical protein
MPFTGVARVGDGVVVLRSGETSLDIVGEPPGGCLNVTTFVTSDDGVRTAALDVRTADALAGVAVLTDGLALAAVDLASGTPHRGFFDPLFAYAAGADASPGALADFLRSPPLDGRTDDDRTLVLALRTP